MKKKIALTLLLLMVATAILAACANTPATEKRVRWEEAETHTFKVSLADYNTAENATTVFNSYSQGQNTYYKDFAASAYDAAQGDEIRPTNLTGTYTMTVSTEGDDFVVKTEQELFLQYKKGDITEDMFTALTEANLVVADGNNLFAAAEGEFVTLRSTTDTTVRFKNSTKQTPVESSTTVKGFYLGRVHQEVSVYEVSTEYNFEEKRPTATVTLKMGNAEATEETYKLPRNSGERIIDSNQLLMYVRSLDKSSTSFQDTPSILVFNPLTHESATTYFSLGREQKSLLTDASNRDLYTVLDTVTVTIGNRGYMVQQNLPEKLLKQGYDKKVSGNGDFAKLTTLRFRVGYLAYEIADYADGNYLDSINYLVAERFVEDYALISDGKVIEVNATNYTRFISIYNALTNMSPDQKAAVETLLNKMLDKEGEVTIESLYQQALEVKDEIDQAQQPQE